MQTHNVRECGLVWVIFRNWVFNGQWVLPWLNVATPAVTNAHSSLHIPAVVLALHFLFLLSPFSPVPVYPLSSIPFSPENIVFLLSAPCRYTLTKMSRGIILNGLQRNHMYLTARSLLTSSLCPFEVPVHKGREVAEAIRPHFELRTIQILRRSQEATYPLREY
jgi:hypothetical protein